VRSAPLQKGQILCSNLPQCDRNNLGLAVGLTRRSVSRAALPLRAYLARDE
jgi:hypothetical protein